VKRVLIIPAAGRGSRLNTTTPKVLFPVNGRPMVDYLLELYAPWVERTILIVHPSFAHAVEEHCSSRGFPIDFELQESPTGMLDAILTPWERVRALEPDSVWITWCDQVAVEPDTLQRLAAEEAAHPDAAVILPTLERREPYIHFQRDEQDRISGILHRREGDVMPEVGESDLGLFALSGDAYLNRLPAFAQANATGSATGERNFLPFIPWLRSRAPVHTFPAHNDMESVGVNDAADLALMENYLRSRA
jgi:bifunctional UDP-N-acetylglucosamine pyrophosphorylase/glucosamine-1-phosphate N-acetyltransferase